MKTLLTTFLILPSLAGFGQSGITLQDNRLTSSGISLYNDSIRVGYHWLNTNAKPIRDTIPVLIVFAESPSRITVSATVKYMMGYLVREQNGYYDASRKTTNINGFSTSIYTPRPLMINVKYLDGNRLDIADKNHVLMSKEIKP